MYKKTLIIILSIITLSVYAQIDRIEPAFWWTGMKNKNLQLLIHGTNISSSQIIINYTGVKVLKVNKVDNPNYLFANLIIDTKTAKPGKFNITFVRNGKTTATYTYELKARRNGSAQRESFTSADVMYLLMPDRFANGDLSNDNIESQPEKIDRKEMNGRHGGDIKGIQNNLDYIQKLGATAIWCTPVQENNTSKFSYHGYAISDYYKIDPRFGSNQDYVNFVEASHQKGLKVVMDMVSNHCGIGHWWMNDLPSTDWVHQWREFTNTIHKANTIKDIHASEIDKKLHLDGWFDKSMPDMNQQNPFFWTYFIQNSIWWIEYANLDGIRMDTYPYNDRNAMAVWAKAITTEYPKFNIVGEAWLHNSQDIAFWQKDAVNALKYNSQLPSVMDFILQKSLTTCFDEHGKPWEDIGMNRLYNTIVNDYLYANTNNLLIFAENHDTQRFNHLLKNDFDKYKMAMAFLMTTRGIPQIYYGTEIGMTGNKDLGDGDIRRDFPGGWGGDSINAFHSNSRTSVQNQYFDYLSKLLNWRKNKKVIHTGLLTHYVPKDDIYVYFRYNNKEKVMVIINNNLTEQKIQLNRYAESLLNLSYGTDVMTEKTYNLKHELVISKQTTLILELK